MCRLRRDQQGVAVGWTLGHHLDADGAARAGPILDDDRLAPCLRQLLRHRSRNDVGRAARSEWIDDAHRLGGKLLRQSRRNADGQRHANQQTLQHQHSILNRPRESSKWIISITVAPSS